MFLDVQKCYMNLKKVAMLWQTLAMSGKVCYNEEIDKYETTGLHKQPEKTVGDSLFWQLQERPHAKELWDYNYPFEKLLGMWMQPRYMDMANSLIEELNLFGKNMFVLNLI